MEDPLLLEGRDPEDASYCPPGLPSGEVVFPSLPARLLAEATALCEANTGKPGRWHRLGFTPTMWLALQYQKAARSGGAAKPLPHHG